MSPKRVSYTASAVPVASSSPPQEVEQIKQSFDRWLQKRGKSTTTRRLYVRNVTEFLLWLQDYPPHPDVKPDQLVGRFFAALEEKEPGNSGNLRRTTAARALLTFLGHPPEMSRSQQGPYGGLRKGQGARYLTLEDSVAVMQAVRERGDTQEVAVVGLLLLSEMSPRLLCSLTIADLKNLDAEAQGWSVVRGPSRWQFNVSKPISALLLQLAEARTNDRAPLFVDNNGDPLSRQSLDAIMKQIGEEAGIPDLAAYRLTMSRSKRSGQGVGWDALPGKTPRQKRSS